MAHPLVYHVKMTFNGQLWHHFWCQEVREGGRTVSFLNRQIPRLERVKEGYTTTPIALTPLTIVLDRIAYYAYAEPMPDWFKL
jgi:hypothetical protein